MQEKYRDVFLNVRASGLMICTRWIYLAWVVMALLFATAVVCLAQEDNKGKIVVQEWHKAGLIAALSDPEQSTVIAALSRQDWVLIPVILKTLDEPARQKLIPQIENFFISDNPKVTEDAVQALEQLGTTRSIPALEKLLMAKDEGVVLSAAHALGRLGGKRKSPLCTREITHA